jgi:predicted DNA-binding transcriptional regulator AlpA
MSKQEVDTTSRLWSITDVADFLGIPVGTLYQWRARRYGPKGYRIGRYVKYFPEEVRTWASNQPKELA